MKVIQGRAGGEVERKEGSKGNFISMEGRFVGILRSPSVPLFRSLKLYLKAILKILLCHMNGFRCSPEDCDRCDYLARIAGVCGLGFEEFTAKPAFPLQFVS